MVVKINQKIPYFNCVPDSLEKAFSPLLVTKAVEKTVRTICM